MQGRVWYVLHVNSFQLACIKQCLGIGSVERAANHLIRHLGLDRQSSPFHIAAVKATSAVVQNAHAQAATLQTMLDDIFEDIYQHFDGMIDADVVYPAEQPLRDALKEFLKTAVPQFDEAIAELEIIKASYGTPDVVDQQDLHTAADQSDSRLREQASDANTTFVATVLMKATRLRRLWLGGDARSPVRP